MVVDPEYDCDDAYGPIDDESTEDRVLCQRCNLMRDITDGFTFGDDRWICMDCTQEEINDTIAEREALRDSLKTATDELAEMRQS